MNQTLNQTSSGIGRRFAQIVIAGTAAITLVACSGSSDSGTETTPSPYAGKYSLVAKSNKTGERAGLMVVETSGAISSVEFTGLTTAPLKGSVNGKGDFTTSAASGDKFFGTINEKQQVTGEMVLIAVDPNLQIPVTGSPAK